MQIRKNNVEGVTVSEHCGGERWCACACAQTYLRDHRIVLVGSAQTLTASSMSASLYIVYQIRAAAPHGGHRNCATPTPSLRRGKVVGGLCAVLSSYAHSSYMFSCAQLKITGVVRIYFCSPIKPVQDLHYDISSLVIYNVCLSISDVSINCPIIVCL